MNLHGIVRGVITAVNPDVTVALSESTGYTTNTDGSQVPTYNSFPVGAQIQALSGKDLRQVQGLNLNGTLRAVYLFGDVEAIVRVLKKGGDVITDSNNNVWLVNQVLDTWAGADGGWCKIVMTLQDGS
jgi:hypothetical protein